MTTKPKRLVAPWRRIIGTGKGADRGYTARCQRAIERGSFTPPGTKPNATDPAKVERKRAARMARR